MAIDRIELHHVRVPLHEPFRISSGAVSEKDTIVCAMAAGGLVGYGEASPMAGSFYSDDSPDTVWRELEERLVPLLLGRGGTAPESVGALLAGTGASGFARAGLETAAWDLDARARGVPLRALLGGDDSPVESGLAVGIYPTTDELLAACDRHLVEGYRRLKIKIRPGWDVAPLEAVRRRFPAIPLMVDANAAYRFPEHRDVFVAMDAMGLVMIEQPLAREAIADSARLQEALRTPVCLDESAEDLATVDEAIRLGACRIVNLKLQRVGGLGPGRAMHARCAAAGIRTWVGTMPELGIASWQAVHFAALAGRDYPTDVESSARWFVDEITDPPIRVRDGKIEIPDGAGTGARVVPEKLRKYGVRSRTFPRR